MSETHVLVVRNRQGELWDRITGSESDLRQQGVGFTTVRGQLAWTCYLWRAGTLVAKCKCGVWEGVKP